jgi:uncharacterized coiled-coil protein SlyX
MTRIALMNHARLRHTKTEAYNKEISEHLNKIADLTQEITILNTKTSEQDQKIKELNEELTHNQRLFEEWRKGHYALDQQLTQVKDKCSRYESIIDHIINNS